MISTYYTDVSNLQKRDGDGNFVRNEEDHLTFAVKDEFETKAPRYRVRLNSAGEIYDPNDNLALNRLNQKQKIMKESARKTKESHNDYAEVSEQVFGLYLKFLKSYKGIYLKQAKNLRD